MVLGIPITHFIGSIFIAMGVFGVIQTIALYLLERREHRG